jgi:hypothetical protein
MNIRRILKLFQALCLTTASYSLLCFLRKIFWHFESSILQDVTLQTIRQQLSQRSLKKGPISL